VQWVRQSAKRKKIPAVELKEVRTLLGALALRERTMVLLDVVTGLRASELFGLKWADINFDKTRAALRAPSSCKSSAPAKRRRSRTQFQSIRFLRELSARGGITRSTKPLATGSPPAPQQWSKSVLGTTSHAQSDPRGCARGVHREENRVAHFPPHLRNALVCERR
jgi:hypothetical protein